MNGKSMGFEWQMNGIWMANEWEPGQLNGNHGTDELKHSES
jgi:hypothetical protein